MIDVETASNLMPQRKFSLKDFREYVGKFDYISSLMLLQAVSAFMFKQTGVKVGLEFDFFIPEKKKYSLLLTRDFISFCTKQIILNCKKSNLHMNYLDLTKLLDMYINLQTDLDNMDPKSDDAWLWVLRAQNQQWHYLRLPNIIIGRYLYIFQQLRMGNESLLKEINKQLNLDLFDVIKIGFLLFAGHSSIAQKGLNAHYKERDYLNSGNDKLKSLLTKDKIKGFFDIFSTSAEKFKEENNQQSIENELLCKYEFNPLKRYPIIETHSDKEDGKRIIPSLPDLLYACSEGIYYVLLDKLNNSYKEKYFAKIGEIFEKYIGELIRFYHLLAFQLLKIEIKSFKNFFFIKSKV